MFVDTHAHIYLDQFKDDKDEMIRRAKDNNVRKIFLPNIDTTTINDLHALVDDYPQMCYPMIGLHPCSVNLDYQDELDVFQKMLGERKYYGIGETGIDLYWDTSFKTEQIKAFEIQIEWAKAFGLPVIIHSRNSLDLTIEIIEKHHSSELRGIFHCFNGSIEQCERIINLNFHMGLGGVITFKNSKMDEVLEFIPLKNVVLETDAPYLSPTPHRSKRNESSYIPLIAQKLAECKNMDLEEIETLTSIQAKKVFQLRE